MKNLNFIDLFSGIGGIKYGFELAGGKCLYSCEIDKAANTTYNANFPNTPSHGDITTVETKDIPSHSILVAGFPCQAFSVAGKRLGFEDTRGTLFFEIARILDAKSPECFMLENVKGLIGHDKGNTFEIMREILTNLGYFLHVAVLSPHTHANIPQNRERVFIVGFRDDREFQFPTRVALSTKWRSLIESTKQENRYYYKNSKSPSHAKIKKEVKSQGAIYQYRRYYIRENKNGVCPTLTANMGTGGHNVPLILDNWGIRKLTPRECARFQGFPDSFILPKIGAGSGDSHLYKQIGNSVCVPLIRRIAEKIFEVL